MSDTPAFTAFTHVAQHQPPEVALVLGSGMGHLAGRLCVVARVPFHAVPGLAAPTVVGHGGCLTLGDWAGKRVLLFEGRLHYYEGHPWGNVVQPVQIAHDLGARVLLLTNAAGGIHDALGPGSLLAIRDHIEWTRPYCWRQPGPGALGPERRSPYSAPLRQQLLRAARSLGIEVHEGVYAAVTGPSYETPAEIRALKTWGADAVGMSTAREVQQGFGLGLECAAVSCITNKAAGLSAAPINHEEVLTTAKAQGERLANLLEQVLHWLEPPRDPRQDPEGTAAG
jgi:purine-nucleoside phosphorylase